MARISELPPADPLLGEETVPIVQSGQMRRANLQDLVEALLGDIHLRGIVGAGTIAAREAYTYRHGGTPDVEEGAVWLTKQADTGLRKDVWVTAGNATPGGDGTLAAYTGWHSLKTQHEMDNLALGKWNVLAKEKVEALVDALADIAALQAPVISDFRAKALSTAAHPDVLLSWALSGSEPASVTVGWGGFEVGVSPKAREFAPKDWAASKPLFVRGNSLSDITGRTDKWSQVLATSLGVTLYTTAKWSSDARQVYRSGAAEIWLTLAGNLLAAAGTSRSVTHINGAAPSADSTVSPQSFLNEAPGTTGTDNVSMTGTIIDGAETRHVTVSIPNSGSTAYSVVQDAGQAELALSGPVLFVPDVARQVAQADNVIWSGNNYFYSGVPNTYGDHTNPGMWIDLARMIAQCEGQRVLILPVIPDATWTDRGLGTPYTAMLAANARTETLYPQYVARDALGRTLLERLQAAGDGSANDNADIAAGFVPRSLRADSLHLNAAGDAVVAAFVEEAFADQALPPAITQATMFTLTATPAVGEPVNAVATIESSAVSALRFDVDTLYANGAAGGGNTLYLTIAEGVAATAVGGLFNSAESGVLTIYERTDVAPFYAEVRPAVTAADVGLSKVANLAPDELPVSTAQQEVLDMKVSQAALSAAIDTRVMTVSAFASIATTSIPAGTSVIRTAGYAVAGDGGGAFYDVGLPADPAITSTRVVRTSANNRRVQLAKSQAVNILMVGGKPATAGTTTIAARGGSGTAAEIAAAIAAAENNNYAMAAAFSVVDELILPGTRSTIFAYRTDSGLLPEIPAAKTLRGDVTVTLTGTGLTLNDRSKLLGPSIDGNNGNTMLRATGKTAFKVDIPFMGAALKNGFYFDTCTAFSVRVERASHFGSAATNPESEGAIIYAANCSNFSFHVGEGDGTWGLGSVSLYNCSDALLTGYIRDTRFRAFSIGGSGTGKGIRISAPKIRRIGALAPAGSDNGVGTNGIFCPGAADPSWVIIDNPDIEDVGENFVEGVCTINNPTFRNSAGYDTNLNTPTPSGVGDLEEPLDFGRIGA